MNEIASPDEILASLRTANSTRGEAQAFIHVAGYSFKLGFDKIKWLLEGERWRECGFDTIEAFADSIQFGKAMKAASKETKELAVLFKEADKEKPLSNYRVAKTLNVGEATVRRATASNDAPARKRGSKAKGADSGAASNDAPPALPSGERAGSYVASKAESKDAKRRKRDEREQKVADRILALPAAKYGVIYADPEWRFEFWSDDGKNNSSADNHYTTSTLDVIKSRDVASIAAEDCALFLWATAPMLPQALEVMEAWGFSYATSFVWVKDRPGTGYWARNQHELLLLGLRGKLPAPAPGDQCGSAIMAPVGAHSTKPTLVYDLIESYFPFLPKIELNAREQRDGWTAWGLETPSSAAE
jgi:N6-adenosine-specific RNA methylase IME4